MFATTGALAPQRSAERKVRLRKGEGVRMKTQAKDFKLLALYGLLQHDKSSLRTFLLLFSKSIYNIFLLLKRRWLRKTKFFEDGGVLFSSHAFLLYDRF